MRNRGSFYDEEELSAAKRSKENNCFLWEEFGLAFILTTHKKRRRLSTFK
jgi:hypothetical protein